jgi:uncharacterized protein YbjQ (UPF0145 family)
MSWLDKLASGLLGAGSARPLSPKEEAARARRAEWESALQTGRVPSFVEARLKASASGKAPWISTTTPAELRIATRHGIRPIAMVSGTCWYHFGYSWTKGHAEGWHQALRRIKAEAVALGANAVLDVRMRTVRIETRDSMDYTILGTAVRIDGIPPSPDPVVATVPALEFVRLLEAGIVPTGIAIGAQYEWLNNYRPPTRGLLGAWKSQPLTELGQFWEGIRRRALAELRQDGQRQGDGVLAHTHFGQILRHEKTARYLGRHIVIGTVVHSRRSGSNASPAIGPVVDMRDEASPLRGAAARRHDAYPVAEEGGAI